MSLKRTDLADQFKRYAAALRDSVKASKTDVNWVNSVETSYIGELNRIGRGLLGIDLDLFKVLDHRQPPGERANTWRFIRFFYADPINYRAGEFHSKELSRWKFESDGISCRLVTRNEASAEAIVGVLNVWVGNVADIARKNRTVNVRLMEFSRENPELVATFKTSTDWAKHTQILAATIRKQPFYKQWRQEQKLKVEDPKVTAIDRLNPRESEREDC